MEKVVGDGIGMPYAVCIKTKGRRLKNESKEKS
jgi:hypothetical protein